MCQLLETIKLENGKLVNLEYHNSRLNDSRRKLLGCSDRWQLEEQIVIPEEYQTGLFRCRIQYSHTIENVELIPHQLRTFKSLKVIIDNQIDYAYKYADRKSLDHLYGQREDSDEIIIVKNGMVTDCTIGNLIFWDGYRWITPATPLLNGTRRRQLLNDGLIQEREIRMNELPAFRKVAIINVFYGMENLSEIPMEAIVLH